jgi:hypothetical protein
MIASRRAKARIPVTPYQSYNPADPRAVILPTVVWNSANGRSQVEITGLAAVWIDSVSGGTIQAHFIDREAFDSTGSASAPFSGARGRPVLVK